jgi:membrane-associated phospholipid phosphatase
MRAEPAHPLLVNRIRPRTVSLLACCTVLTVVLGVLVAHQSRVDGLDRAIDSWVIGSTSSHRSLLQWLAYPPNLVPAGLASLIMAAICLATGRLKGAILAATAVPAASALCDSLIKPLVRRSSDLSYPSGHVTSILALTAMLTVLLVLPPQPLIKGRSRLLIPAATGVIASGVAVAVIGLRWHFFTDTIGGAALGTGTVCALALILDLPAISRWLETPTNWLISRAPHRRCRGGAGQNETALGRIRSPS